jgi:heme A synthase
MRILIEYIVPILLPTALWFAWLAWMSRRANGRRKADWQTVPLSWLLAAGFVLAMLIAVGGTMISGYGTGHYHPAAVDQKGRIIPGGFN